MPDLGLELHDAGVTVAARVGDRAAIIAESPGFALVDGVTLSTGEDALRSARRKPRHVHSRFWQELDIEPLGRPFPHDWSAADLAHAHLENLWRAAGGGFDRVLMAISSGFSKRQLDIALGIARAARIPAAGVIDSAVAALETRQVTGEVIHLDLHLHRVVATRLTVGDEIVRGEVETVDGVGLASLQDTWARRIADGLVRATRFDPFHAGESEQRLYDRLAGWLTGARENGRTTVGFDRPGGEHSIELELDDLIAAAEPAYTVIEDLARRLSAKGEPPTLALPHRAAELPGLEHRLAAGGWRVHTLPAGAAAIGALAAGSLLVPTDGALRFITRLGERHGAA